MVGHFEGVRLQEGRERRRRKVWILHRGWGVWATLMDGAGQRRPKARCRICRRRASRPSPSPTLIALIGKDVLQLKPRPTNPGPGPLSLYDQPTAACDLSPTTVPYPETTSELNAAFPLVSTAVFGYKRTSPGLMGYDCLI